jgi:release factor glutamine methyltransferase
VVQAIPDAGVSRRAHVPLPRRLLRRAIHFLSYHFILNRRRTIRVQAGGFRLDVPPTVFHPRYSLASEYFAQFVSRLDLAGKRVADVGTGTGILALAAARAGAASVLGLDINPNAAAAARANAEANGLGARVGAVCSNLLAAVAPLPLFDVILSNPPFFPGEPLNLADRAWHAGPNYRDINALFSQARERLNPGGRFYAVLSSDSDLDRLTALMEMAGFRARVVAERSIVIETLIIYELWAGDHPAANR